MYIYIYIYTYKSFSGGTASSKSSSMHSNNVTIICNGTMQFMELPLPTLTWIPNMFARLAEDLARLSLLDFHMFHMYHVSGDSKRRCVGSFQRRGHEVLPKDT